MICLDTNVLIWAAQTEDLSADALLVERARRYLDHLEFIRSPVGIPAPVLAEYLVKLQNMECLDAHIAALFERFQILPMSAQAAVIAGRLMSHKADLQSVQKNAGHPRQAVRVDAMVVAIAAAEGATLISHDPGIRQLATLADVPWREVPEIYSQSEIFPASEP